MGACSAATLRPAHRRSVPVAGVSSGSRQGTPSARATSAGGIVFRSGQDGGRELLLGRRDKERDGRTWSLPKGTQDGHETLAETALREVTEETGLHVRILAAMDPIHYFFVQRGVRIYKTVHYFLMEAIGGDLEDYDHEFDEVRWVPIAEAETLMSFSTERDLVAHALEVAEAAEVAGPGAGAGAGAESVEAGDPAQPGGASASSEAT